MEDNLLSKFEVEVLLKEYDHRFEEMKLHSNRYHAQSNITYAYITCLIAIASFLITNNGFFYSVLIDVRNLFVLILLIFVLIVAYYLYSLMQDALCMIYINGIRLSSIEKLINIKMNRELLLWDSKIISRYHNSKWIFKGWIKPSFILVFWAFLMVVILNIILCIVCYSYAKIFFWWYFSISTVLFIYNIWQTFTLNTTGVRFLTDLVNKVADNEK